MITKKIYIEYREVNALADAYSVQLASEDGTFGVKKYSTDEVVISSGTAVDNPSTGLYEYELTVDTGVIYVASWKIMSSSVSEPQYISQTIGPFSDTDSVRAVADYRGSLIQGTVNNLFLKITNLEGSPVNAVSITTTIKDENGVEVESGTPEKLADGYYAYEWEIAAAQTVGTYSVEWSYNDGVTDRLELQYVVVATDVTDTVQYSGRVAELRTAFEYYIHCAQNIPVFYEQNMPSDDNTTFQFSFPRWNQSAGTRVYRNNKLLNSGYEINYFKGKVLFDNPLTSYDTIHASYNFRWFSDDELDRFLSDALHTINLQTPTSGYSLNMLPERYFPTLLQGASVFALRHMMLCLQFQQPQKVFGGPDGASKAFSNLDALKKNYEESWKAGLEQKKLGPYVGLTKMVVVPEYTLPGGRSRWFRMLFKS